MVASVCSILCLACGSSESGEPSEAGEPTSSAASGGGSVVVRPGASVELDWTSCSLVTGDDDGRAECATAMVPLRWDQPDGRSIEIFVKRLRASRSRGQIWLLNGGPGGTGADFEGFADAITQALPLDVYLPDHRGAGRSTRLGCAAEDEQSPQGFTITPDEMPSCIASIEEHWGDGLAGFSTTNAARDLGFLIENRKGEEPAYVYGVSYGTQWAHRYLRLFPHQAAGVILDSIVHPELTINKLSKYDEHFNDAGKQYLHACGDDAFCSNKLGSDPWLKATSLMNDVYAGNHCPEFLQIGLSRHGLRGLFGSLLFRYWEERAVVPAFLYRLERCSPADVAALQHLVAILDAESPLTETRRLFGQLLGVNISLSERWPSPPPPLEEIDAYAEQALVSLDVSSRLAHTYDLWPRYSPDEYASQWADTDVPLLMLQGTLDPATPHEAAVLVGEHFAGANQTFVSLPGTPHGAFTSPTSSGVPCASTLFAGFLADPKNLPDTSCVDEMLPVSFEGEPELAAAAFGTLDLWENEGASAAVRAIDSQRYQLVARRLRALRGAPAIEH
jgi:pimeloyl-ACP methyl ester carboxylesterase